MALYLKEFDNNQKNRLSKYISMSLLETQAVVKHFGELRAVDGVDLACEKGELCSVIGPNGAGKTTLINLITGQLRSDAGKIIFRGEDITNLQPYDITKRGLARSFQITSIFPRLTALENVQVAMQAKRRKSLNFFSSAKNELRDESLKILETVGLARHATEVSGELSHGDQKLMELAIGLAEDPYLLLLDEPTAGMGSEETITTMRLIQKLNREQGLSILFVEHDMDVVLTISQRIVVMAKGTIIAQGEPGEISRNEVVRRVYLGE